MADIVDIADFKAQKLAKLEREWDSALIEAELLQKAGNFQHAKPHLERAKALKDQIRKLDPKPERPFTLPDSPQLNWDKKPGMDIEFTFSHDLGNSLGRDPDPKKG